MKSHSEHERKADIVEMTVGETRWRLETGDCLAMRLDCPIVFRNPPRKAARYLVALTTLSFNEWRNR